MLKSVSVTNFKNETLEVELAHPEPSGLIIYNIEGIGGGKANINTSESATGDGSWYNSARCEARNIVIYAKLAQVPSVEGNRHKMYQYFPLKSAVHLRFTTDQRDLYIDGYVESNETPIFSSEEFVTISIICPDPCFYSVSNPYTVFSGTVPMFEFPFSDESVPKPDDPPFEWPKFNENMIKNYDFANPKNSSGQKSFVSSGLTIDDWLLYNPLAGNANVEINDGFIKIMQYTTNTSTIRWYTRLGTLYPHETYTASYLDLTEVHFLTFEVDRESLSVPFEKLLPSTDPKVQFKVTSLANSDDYSFEVCIDTVTGEADSKIVSLRGAKVEPGDIQTLADKDEAGNWKMMVDPGPAPDPYPGTVVFGELAFENAATINYHGTSEVGLTIEVTFIKGTKDLTIYNLSSDEFMTIIGDRVASITGSSIQDGDIIRICTIKGKKTATISRAGGKTYSIIGAISRTSKWITLSIGANVFKVSGSDEDFYASTVFYYNEAYLGL